MTTPPVRFAVGARTHPGMVRTNNEDAYVADDGLFVVADGMGGHQAGEVASALAVDTLRSAHTNGFASVTDVEKAVREANWSIRMQAAENIERAGMGTTVTGVAVLQPDNDDPTPRLAMANVGDSRTYLQRDGRLVRLTIDRSYVQELVRTGQITEQEARFHPRRNIVTRALGIDHNIAVDAWVRACVRGDRYPVCGDGLVDEVPDHEIAAVLGGVADPQLAADQLVEMANRHGGRDNVTVIVADVLDGLDEPPVDDVLPASAVDDGGLPNDVSWADGDPNATTVMAATTTTAPRTTSSPNADNATAVLPVTPAGATAAAPALRRRFGVPQLLFLFALGAIATVVIVVAVLALQSDSDTPNSPSDSPSDTVTVTTVADSAPASDSNVTVSPGATTTTTPPTVESAPVTQPVTGDSARAGVITP